MTTKTSNLAARSRHDWSAIAAELDSEGYAVLPGFLDEEQIAQFSDLANAGHASSVHTTLESVDLGRGDVWRTYSPVHDLSRSVRSLYERLVSMASRWNQIMSVADTHNAIGTALIEVTRLREGDYQALHQAGAAASPSPLQVVALLSEPDTDYSGGQFVMTEQRPRMQSRPMVLPIRKGDVAIISTANRPFKGSKGYYRVNMKHAISRVRGGERLGVEIIFNAAARATHG